MLSKAKIGQGKDTQDTGTAKIKRQKSNSAVGMVVSGRVAAYFKKLVIVGY